MSIGITMILPGAVLMVSDGRLTRPLVNNKIISDNIEKINIVKEKMAVISFGIQQATDQAISYLKLHSEDENTLEEQVSILEESLEKGWNDFVSALATDVDKSNPVIRSAIIAGGIFHDKPFFAGVLRDFNDVQPPTVCTNTLNFNVIGGESQGAMMKFQSRAQEVITRVKSIDNYNNELATELLKAAGQTIREVSVNDTTIGGVIRYCIFHPELDPIIGIWEE